MGGMIGAMSGKIVFQAGLLLFAARLDGHKTMATIDPMAKTTVIGSELADNLRFDLDEDQTLAVRHRHVVGIDHAEVRLRRVIVRQMGGAARIVIGRDLLSELAIRLDFAHARLRVFDSSERRAVGQGQSAVELDASFLPRCLVAMGREPAGTSQMVVLTGNAASSGRTTTIVFGDTAIQTFPVAQDTPCAGPTLAAPWQSFQKAELILDLPGGHLFVKDSHVEDDALPSQ